MYNFKLSEERQQFQEMARNFAEKEVKPFETLRALVSQKETLTQS